MSCAFKDLCTYMEHRCSHHVPITFDWLRSSGNVKTPISLSGSRNKEKKVVEVQKPVVEERQEEVGSKYVKQKSRANSIQTKHSNYATYYRPGNKLQSRAYIFC